MSPPARLFKPADYTRPTAKPPQMAAHIAPSTNPADVCVNTHDDPDVITYEIGPHEWDGVGAPYDTQGEDGHWYRF